MKRFLYLRIVAIVTLVIEISYMTYLISIWSKQNFTRYWYLATVNMSTMLPFVLHSLSVIFIYQKFYPDKEPAKPAVLFFRIIAVISWVWITILFIGSLFSVMNEQTGGWTNIATLWFIIIVLVVIQLFGSRRLLSTIRKNARAQLENSFT